MIKNNLIKFSLYIKWQRSKHKLVILKIIYVSFTVCCLLFQYSPSLPKCRISEHDEEVTIINVYSQVLLYLTLINQISFEIELMLIFFVLAKNKLLNLVDAIPNIVN